MADLDPTPRHTSTLQEVTKTDVHGRESKVELVYIKGTQVNFLILPGACVCTEMG